MIDPIVDLSRKKPRGTFSRYTIPTGTVCIDQNFLKDLPEKAKVAGGRAGDSPGR